MKIKMTQRYQDECKLKVTRALQGQWYCTESKGFSYQFLVKKIMPSETLSLNSNSGLEYRITIKLTRQEAATPQANLLRFRKALMSDHNAQSMSNSTWLKSTISNVLKSLHTQESMGMREKAEIAVDCLILGRCKFLGLCSFSTMLVIYFPQRHPITHSL